jgi:hypothetical protein
VDGGIGGGSGDDAATPTTAVARALLKASNARAKVTAAEGAPHPDLPGLRLLRRTEVAGRQVDWADGPLWLVGLDSGVNVTRDPLRWLARIGGLFDAQRHNETGAFGAHPSDGYFHTLNHRWQVSSVTSITMTPATASRAAFRVGSQWAGVPQQRYVVFAGPGATEAKGPQDLPPLPRAMLQLAAQEGSTSFFSALREHYGYEHGRLLCSTRGAAVGAKPKFFTGRSDGWLFRQYGYMRSGVAQEGVQSHPKFSPRKVSAGWVVRNVGWWRGKVGGGVVRSTALPSLTILCSTPPHVGYVSGRAAGHGRQGAQPRRSDRRHPRRGPPI